MKYHIVIKLTKNFYKQLPVQYPHWKELIPNKSLAICHFYPEFDSYFGQYAFDFWVTKEYEKQLSDWNDEESQNNLDRTFRIILQQDYVLPPRFLEGLRRVKYIEEATGLTLVETILPKPQVSVAKSYAAKAHAELIHLKSAQLLTKGSPDITIAVLDTGVNMVHPELTGKLVRPADFVNIQGLDTSSFIGDNLDYDNVPEDEVGHGTHVAGIIAGKGLNMEEGVCPNCSIMPVRVLATMKDGNRYVGAGIIDNINTGIKYAVDHGASIINMSLGIQHEGGGLPHEDIIRYALSKNVTIVAASGNDGKPIKYYPGALPGVIAVGAVDDGAQVTNFSSYGANITVVAPGMNIYSSYSNKTYAYASGTSQASPFVCGSIGLMKSYAQKAGVRLSNATIRYILQHTSDKIDSDLRNEKAGYGVINLADAFKLLQYIINK